MHSPELKRSQRISDLPKFLFSLETLLRHREDLEQKERDELLRLTYRYQTELRRRDDLSLKFRDTMRDISIKRSENSDHLELNWHYLYINRLTQEIGESETCLARLQSEIEAQKEVVIEAAKKKKVLASLRSRREKEFTAAAEKQEQKEVDDLVVTRYGMRKAGQKETSDEQKQAPAVKREHQAS